jgi:sugar diacid utilization regulator
MTMIHRLKQRFPNILIQTNSPSFANDYEWYFSSEENVYFGIPKKDLSQDERDLLQLLFNRYTFPMSLVGTANADLWYQLLFQGSDFQKPMDMEAVRFVQFYISSHDYELHDIIDAIRNAVTPNVELLFISPNEGIIVEPLSPLAMSKQDLSSLQSILETDFFFNVRFYFGRFFQLNKYIHQNFQAERQLFQWAKEHLDHKLLTFESIVPMFLMDHIPPSIRATIFSSVMSILKEDETLHKTVKTYIENQSNASLTAKELYIHRNSLQYRIDKFIEKSGIDIKTFTGAFTVYFAILHDELSKLPETE